MADDINLMQAQLGLPNYGGSANPLGVPTIAAPPPPPVMHPGEVSTNLVQQAQQQTMQTLQTAQMTRPGAMGGYGTPGTGGGYGAFPTAGPMGPMGGFAQQFQANMGAINQGQFGNPYYAQALSGMMGMPGFNQTMLPSPAMMTPPGMGIFRPFPQGPTPAIPPVPQMPLIQHPFTPQLPAPRFQTPLEYDYNVGNQRGQQYMSAFLSTPGAIARGATAIGGSYLGGALGAAAGGFLGGARGVGIGSAIGSLGGMALSELGGFGQTAEHIADRTNLFRSVALRGQQMRGISQNFVVGGPELHGSGRGMTASGSQHLGRLIEDLAYDPKFRKEMGGPSQFSAQDMARITRMAGDQGLLDMAQSPEQVRDQVRNVAKGVRSFMRIAGEPDVHEAIKQMGQLRAMGLSMPQIDTTMQNVRMYAKMAGTTVKSLMEGAGLQGAMVFQQQGLSAGLGLQVGAASMGYARQAIAGGTFTPSQAALLGGVQGIAQRDMETSAAMLKMPVLTAAVSQLGAGGTFGLNAGGVRNLFGGRMNIDQMATGGANNLLAAVNKGGVGALAMFQTQQNELADQLGKALGPEGLNLMKMNQVVQTQKMLGIQGPGGFVTAAKAMGMDDQAARQMMLQANSPGYTRNMMQQFNRQVSDLRAQTREQQDREAPGFLDSLTYERGMSRNVYSNARSTYRSFRDLVEGVGTLFTEGADDAGLRKRGQVRLRRPRELQATDQELRFAAEVTPDQEKEFDREVAAERARTSDTSALFSVGGRGYGRGWVTKSITDRLGGPGDVLRQVRENQGGMAGVFGGGLLERYGRFAGGLGTTISSALGLTPSLWGSASYSDSLRKDLENQNRGSEISARITNASGSDIVEAKTQLGKELGLSDDQVSRLQSSAVEKMTAAAKANGSNWFNRTFGRGGTKATGEDYARIAQEVGAQAGLSQDQMAKLQQNPELLLSTAGRLAKESAGKNKDWFRTATGFDTETAQNTTDAILETRKQHSEALFGKNPYIFDIGESRREEAKRVLLTRYKDPEVGAFAALTEAASRNEPGAAEKKMAYLNSLSPEKQKLVIEQSAALLKTAKDQGVDDLISDSGAMLAQKDPKDITSFMAKERGSALASLRAQDRVEGYKQMFGEEVIDLGNKMDELAKDTKATAKLSKATRGFVKQWGQATSDEERKDLEKKIRDYAVRVGTAAGDIRGGDISGKEKPIQEAKEGLVDLQTELAEVFPQAVDTFDESVKSFAEAVSVLSGKKDLSLPNDVNE